MPNQDWNKGASNILKSEMVRAGVNYPELVQRLQTIGVVETYHSVAAKINRGTFSFAFFIQCMKALGKSEIRL